MRRLLFALLLVLSCITTARAEIAVPPAGLVVDQAGVLTAADRAEIESALRALRDAPHGAAMAILVVDTIPDGDIETYAITVARAWGLGRKDVNDGLLLVHGVKDHRYRFEVGTGLQGDIPDGAIGDIGRTVFAPKAKAGDYHGAYLDTVAAIAARLAGASPPVTAPVAAAREGTTAPPPVDEMPDNVLAAMFLIALAGGILFHKNFLLVLGATPATTAGVVAALHPPASLSIAMTAGVAACLAFFVALVIRNPIILVNLFFSILFNSRSSSSSSDSSSSDSSSFGGGDFDGGGASGDS